MKRLPLAFSLAALAATLGLLMFTLLGRTPPPDPVNAYRLEKLNEINDMVLARAVIPDGYLYYVDGADLRAALEQYSTQTAVLWDTYALRGTDIANALFYEHKESPGDYDQPQLYYEWVGRIARNALYRNADALCRADPLLCYPLAKEGGGSYGLWAHTIHLPVVIGEDASARTETYFALVDQLLLQLEAARRVSPP